MLRAEPHVGAEDPEDAGLGLLALAVVPAVHDRDDRPVLEERVGDGEAGHPKPRHEGTQPGPVGVPVGEGLEPGGRGHRLATHSP